jgi:3-dehydroquinate dehydratase II
MLGRRPSQHYGTLTLSDLEGQVRAWGAERDMAVATFQTNHEGAFLEHVHGLIGTVDGAIMNPGAWTHYQWSIRDALELLGAPFVEVHLSDIEAREPHRRISVVREIARAAVWGKGPDGYREALDILAGALR